MPKKKKTIKKEKCLHIICFKIQYSNGETLSCKKCDEVLRFVDNEGDVQFINM